MVQPKVTIKRRVVKADLAASDVTPRAMEAASPADTSYTMYNQPAIPIQKPGTFGITSISATQPPNTIIKEHKNNLTPRAGFVGPQAFKMK